MTGQLSLYNLYVSIKLSYPVLAASISDDVISVGINALVSDNSDGQSAADRLRIKLRDLPEIYRRVLENALTELGYS